MRSLLGRHLQTGPLAGSSKSSAVPHIEAVDGKGRKIFAAVNETSSRLARKEIMMGAEPTCEQGQTSVLGEKFRVLYRTMGRLASRRMEGYPGLEVQSNEPGSLLE